MFNLLITLLYTSLIISSVYSATCCVIRETEDDCNAESGAGSPCIWLDPTNDVQLAIILANPLLNLGENGGACVTSMWAACQAVDPGQDCVNPNRPSHDPNFVPNNCYLECTSSYGYNIQFLIDESGSITWYDQSAYTLTIDFIISTLDTAISDSTNISALAFSMHNDFLYSFDWPQSSDRAQIFDVLETEKNNYAASTTDTYTALIDGM